MRNPQMKVDFALHGSEGFEVRILEHSKTAEELNRLEKTYAEQYNAYLPYGYNRQICGVNRDRVSPLARMAPFELNDPNGNDVVISDPINFCARNSLNRRSIYLLLTGKTAFHQGWTTKGNTRKVDPRIKDYVLYDASGNKHRFVGLKAFCDERGLDTHDMRCMIGGQTYTSQGYALSVEAFGKRKSRYVVALTNGDKEIVIDDIITQSRGYGLCPKFVYELANGKKKIYKGWSLKGLSKTPTRH